MNRERFGVSFSIKQCRNFGIVPKEALAWLIAHGFKRFRLMSYWDEHEKSPGKYDFESLDKLVEQIHKSGGVISLCLGARQPRWPENHWPDWAWRLSKIERSEYLYRYLETVVKRYRDVSIIVSWQLENEALLSSFGLRSEIDRKRLVKEFDLVKSLDDSRPIIMSTSTSWGVPMRRPIPDIVGFSFYQITYNNKKARYSKAFHKYWLDIIRSKLIRLIHKKDSFIHELQLEPWGPKNIWEMSKTEQDKSMSIEQITKNIQLAKRTKLNTIDLWGGEWWYWRFLKGDSSVIETVTSVSDAK